MMSSSGDTPTSDSINNTSTGHVIRSRGGVGINILYYHNTLLHNTVKQKEKEKVKLESENDALEEEAESVCIGVECSNTNQLPTQCLFIRNNEFKQLSLKVNSGKQFDFMKCNSLRVLRIPFYLFSWTRSPYHSIPYYFMNSSEVSNQISLIIIV